ncbi:MAG: tetratricopeptide repeat protein [Sedimentisphaerales bacterium]|nr:tetratricopeptide repeat protein [Sedimentisphaerales bacterium]
MKTDNNKHCEPRGKIRTAALCLLLAAATFAAFEGVRNNDFVNFDDDLYVTNNPHVQQGLYAGSIVWAFTSRDASNWHPLTWLSHIIDCVYFGPDPAGHHLVGLGFHIAGVVLLFLILKAMTGALWPSAFVAAAFGLHPLAVESVAWVAQRKNVLSTFFCFLTIAAYVRYSQKPGLWRYLTVAGLFAAGLLSKPMLVTLPFVLILLDHWPLNRIRNKNEETEEKTLHSKFTILNSFYEKIPLLLMSAASCVVTYMAQAQGGAVSDIVKVPLISRAENTLVSYINYIGKVFWPTSLSVLYPFNFSELAAWKAGACLLLLVLVSSAAIILRRRFGWLFTGWFWYLGTLVPVIGLVQIGAQGMADRYMYLPGIGIYIIVAWSAYELAGKLRLPKVIPAAAGASALGVLLLMTRAQVGHWKDSVSLCQYALATTKNNYIMHYNCGVAFWTLGRLDEAIEQYRQALKINPAYAKAHNNLGCALRDKRQTDEALAEFERAIKIEPDYAEAQNNYAVSLAKRGQYEEAIGHFNAAIKAKPCYGDALKNICKAGIDGHKTDEVLETLLAMQQQTPSCAELYYRAATIYDAKGQVEKAVEQLEKGLTPADRQGNRELVNLIKAQLERYSRPTAK